MKRFKYFILAVSLFISVFSNAQELNFSNRFIKSCFYANKAELNICQNNYKEASIYFDSVFLTNNKPFARDLFNYALCEKKLGNIKVADSLFKNLYLEGFSRRSLGSCFDAVNLFQLKKKNEVKERKLYETIEDINKTDQSADALRFTDMEKFLNTVLTNAKRIMKLTHEAEQAPSGTFVLENAGLYIPILHFFQLWNISKGDSLFFKRHPVFSCLKNVDFERYGFAKFLIEETKKRNFDRYTLAQLFEVLGYNIGSNVVTQYDNYIIIKRPDLLRKELLNKINNNRKKFGLESYKDYYIKVRYADSLLTKGKTFETIKNSNYTILLKQQSNNCNFLLASQYRMFYNFTHHQSAWKAYEIFKNRWFKTTSE